MLTLLMATAAALTPIQDAQIPSGDTSARATLESCQFENERWVCRYQMPAIAIVPNGPDAAAAGARREPDAPATGEGVERAAPALEAEVLTPEEQDLVLRCAEASWLSLCTPTQRRTARRLKSEAETDALLRQRVGARIGAGDCAGAERTALEAGRLSLAAQVRAYCRPANAAAE